MSKSHRQIHLMIVAQAEKATLANPAITKDQFIDRAYMDRFLNRIFSDASDENWVLKGGTAIVARVPLARRTTDIDLFTSGYKIEDAQEHLLELLKLDLGDEFSFELINVDDSKSLEQQTSVEIVKLRFAVNIAGVHKRTISVDLAVGPSPIGKIIVAAPKERLLINGFEAFPYRLYPIEHQAAEKVCATFAKYGDGFSSREKDLVDLVVIATLNALDGATLTEAIIFEAARRGLDRITQFKVPSDWGGGYVTEAKRAPACTNYLEISAALDLMKIFIDPALLSNHSGTWDPKQLKWLPFTADY